MPARKPSKKTSSAARGPLPPYGIAIKEAIARGNRSEMTKTASYSRKYLKDLQTALSKLEAAIGKGARL